MARAPRFKVYRNGEYVASCKDIEDAAAIAAMGGIGVTIRDGHSFVVWENDRDGDPGDSFDHVANVAYARMRTR